jgi:hypothetical protein
LSVSRETFNKKGVLYVIEIIKMYQPYALAGLIALNIILILLLIFFVNKVSRLQRRFERFMTPKSKHHNVEAMLLDNIKLINDVRETNERIKIEQEYINSRLKTCIQYMGIVRYNTFEDVGGDLSYAIALLDEDKNGVVLNSLYYREGCYTYGKPIVAGESQYQLSNEEEEAIKKAVENADNARATKKSTDKKVIKNKKTKKIVQKGDAMIVNNSRRSNEVAGA